MTVLVEQTFVSGESKPRAIRTWSDGRLVYDGPNSTTNTEASRPTDVAISTTWESQEAWDRYLKRRDQPMGPSEISVGSTEISVDLDRLLISSGNGPVLPGASFEIDIKMGGLTLDGTTLLSYELSVLDGIASARDANRPADLTILGSYELVLPWLSGETPLRDLIRDLRIEGDVLLLAAVTGAFGLAPDLGPTPDEILGVRYLALLTGWHRECEE